MRVAHISGVCNSTFLAIPLGLRGGFKGQLSSLKSQFQRFLYQMFCLFSQIKEMRFLLCRLGHTPRGWDLGLLGGQNCILFKHGHVANQIKGDSNQNGIQVKCSPYGQTCELEMESIGQISLNFFESVGVLTTQLRVL